MSHYPREHATAATLNRPDSGEHVQRVDRDGDAAEGRDVLDIVATAPRPKRAAADHAHDTAAQVAR